MVVGGVIVVVLSIVLGNWRTAPYRAIEEARLKEQEAPPAPPPVPAPAPFTAPAPAPSGPLTVADAVELAGPNGVVCPTDPVVDGARARLELATDAGFLGVAVVAGAFQDLSDVPPEGEAVLHVEGFAPVPVRWSEALAGPGQGGCDPSPVHLVPSTTAVVGTVTGAAGREVTVEACGRPTVLEEDGSFYADAEAGRPCDVVVRRHFGVFRWEDRRTLRPELGRDAVVEVDAPDVDAVLPFVLEPAADGLRVTADWTRRDLTGQVVVSADGVDAEGDPEAFHLAVGGAAGDVVDVELADGRTVEITLRALTFDDWLVEN